VFELFRIIFRGVIRARLEEERARDSNVNCEPFPFTPQGNGDISGAPPRSFTENALFLQNRTQMPLPSNFVDKIADPIVASDEVS
jgi:hypothetical protein